MSTFVTLIIVFSCLILNVAVLLQPSKGTTGGVLGGSSQSVFGSTGGTTFLFRATMWSAALIMCGALFLTWSRIREGRQSVIDSVPSSNSAPVAPINPTSNTAPGAPATTTEQPAAPSETSAPAAPATGDTSP